MRARVATLLMLLAVAPAAGAGALDRIKAGGVITLGYGAEARPFSFQDSTEKPVGYTVELCGRMVDALKADLGLPALAPKFVRVSRAERLAAVADGRIDLLCDPTVPTPAARKEVSYSIAVFATGIGAVVRTSGTARLQEILSGRAPTTRQPHTFALVGGSHVEQSVIERLRELKLAVETLPVKNYQAGLDAVVAERADAFFGERSALLDILKRAARKDLRVLDRYFTHETLALALARGDEDFRLAVDRALSRVFRSDAFRGLYAKWFGEPSDETLSLFRLSALPE